MRYDKPMNEPRLISDNGLDRNKIEYVEVSEVLLKTIDPLFEESLVVLSLNIADPLFLSDRFIREFARFGQHNVLKILKNNYIQTELSEFSLVLLHLGIKYDTWFAKLTLCIRTLKGYYLYYRNQQLFKWVYQHMRR